MKNTMQKQDFFSKQENKSTFSGWVIRQPKQKSSNSRIRVLLIVLIGIGVFGYFYKNKLFTQEITPSVVSETGYSIWEQIQKEGILTADGDLLTFTHTLTTNEGEKFLLKSKSIPLNNYSSNLSWVFQIIGTIESFYQNLPLIEVDTIGTQTTSENPLASGDVQTDEPINPGVYIAKAGIGFPAEFFENYAFVGEAGNQWKISIKNLDNEKITEITFFNCTTQGDSNCKELTRTFNDTATKKVTTLNWDTFYRLPEVKSRYFQNGNWRGYFINDADDEEVEKIKNLITLTNPEWIKQVVSLYGVKTCLWSNAQSETITSHTVTKTAEGLKVIMEGKGEKTFSCEAMIDLTQATKLKFVDIKVEEPSNQTGTIAEPITEAPEEKTETQSEEVKEVAITSWQPVTPSTKQFPINLEKTMTYNSSRGEYAMTFPSSNISYTSDSTDQDFGQVGVRCSYGTKVIQYSKRDALQSSPSVIVYECKFKEGFKLPGDNYLLKELWTDKKFVIEILDPARFDFAKNISISSF